MKRKIFKILILSACLILFITGIFRGLSQNKQIKKNRIKINKKILFWDQQRKGANGNGGEEKDEGYSNPEKWFEAAAKCGFEYIRLNPVSWKGEGRDFLIGDADNYKGIPEQDFIKLKKRLDIAYKYNLKIVLTMMSLPGHRYRQHNNNKFDYRIWEDKEYQDQALSFWKDLSFRLKDHPAVVGYNPLNEPCPERKYKFYDDNVDSKSIEFKRWLKVNKGTTRDLNNFNKLVVKAIRSSDPYTPIILDSCFHSSPKGYDYMKPVNDKYIIYAFHYWEPWQYVNFSTNKGSYTYPDAMPDLFGNGSKKVKWNSDDLKRNVIPVINWAKKNNIPTSRIMAEEFGIRRQTGGAKAFLADLIKLFNQEGWHWSFWEFRSCGWGGYDYELGTEPPGAEYWKKRDMGALHEDLIERSDNPLWNVISRKFK